MIKLLKKAQCCKFNPDGGLTCSWFDKGTTFDVVKVHDMAYVPVWITRDGWIFRCADAYCCDDDE